MNTYVLIAGIVASLAFLGHLVIGVRSFLGPIIYSGTREIPKRVMHSLFHYMTVYQLLTAVILLLFATGKKIVYLDVVNEGVVQFIGVSYAMFALAQWYVIRQTSVKKASRKLFQWIFWFVIAVCCIVGTVDINIPALVK
ncbi:hypothetical protein V6R21_09595 [Limibacter armeniacum]|uniref:hypothetical protein n=1 Tax=Limibacter armeniacum TaxID=466084 RepID=UPI002FE624D4